MRVLIDGRYLSIPQETGIATYARNLNRLNKDLGHEIEVLCDIPVTGRTPPVLGEVLLYDLGWRGQPGIIGRPFDLASALAREFSRSFQFFDKLTQPGRQSFPQNEHPPGKMDRMKDIARTP